ncbi:GntR family transcriptional regulator [Rhizobium sp. Leaf384]|uniref:FadR/GntR family transcriptional regulator n=1 Tax=unclassified Rhizobium TaxID=2613769 RepID=UPI00071271E7|nr:MULTISPECIES: FadR/GntR family transcriptional regulator [unclassified Rhizobium]KQS79556.1 GntR family transcriptional regulator [Rhizobium sp. Leaf384]KQS82974.1 GntR family transcriptional regulator [Rhizobium sp. Leaf383]
MKEIVGVAPALNAQSNALGKLSAVDRLVEQIRDMITEQRLGIGDALPTERDLSEKFQAGRNTVREALQVLRAYGMVETRPKIGAVISGGHGEALRRLFAFHNGISPDSFRDLQGFRRTLETGVGEHIILTASNADFDRLDAINARILDATSIEDSARCDYDFHAAIVELAGNRTTAAAYNMLRSVIEEVMRLGKADRPVHAVTYQAHAEIIHALRQRDRIAYVYLMSVHLEFGLRFVADAAPNKPLKLFRGDR